MKEEEKELLGKEEEGENGREKGKKLRRVGGGVSGFVIAFICGGFMVS